MNIKQSIQRIGWRLSESVKNDKGFKPNKSDLEAFNVIVDFYDNSKKAMTDNLAFKMYIWHRIEMTKHYNTDIFDNVPQKRLVKTLSNPINAFLERFTEFLNAQEYKSFSENFRHSEKPYFLLSPVQKLEYQNDLNEKLKENEDNLKAFKGELWSVDDVKDNLLSEFTQLKYIVG